MNQLKGAARFRLEGEIPSKYWSSLNKDHAPRDIIYELKDPRQPGSSLKRSDQMAEAAKNFYLDLQHRDLPTGMQDRVDQHVNVVDNLHRRIPPEDLPRLSRQEIGI